RRARGRGGADAAPRHGLAAHEAQLGRGLGGLALPVAPEPRELLLLLAEQSTRVRDDRRAREARGHERRAFGGVEAEREEAAGEGLLVRPQLLVDAAEARGGEKAARAVRALAKAVGAPAPGHGLERGGGPPFPGLPPPPPH